MQTTNKHQNPDIIEEEFMNIAFFTDTYYPDLNGVVITVDNLSKALRKRGHKVYIFAPKIKGDYKDEDPDLIRLSSIKIMSHVEPQIYSPNLIPNKEFRKIFSHKYDIIHAHGNGPYSGLGYFASKVKRIPFVMTFHTIHTLYTHYIFGGKIIKPKMVEKFLSFFAYRCKVVFVPSKKMQDELIKYGVKKKIYISPNFLDFKKFDKVTTGYLHKLLNLPKSAEIILTVVRVGKEKNIDFLLRVFEKVYKKNKNAHFVIVGQGPEKENLEQLAKDLKVSDRIHFTGKIGYEFMPQVYKDANIFVFSSYTETQGICVLEAAASGVPLVVNDDTSFYNMVENEVNGFALPLNEEKFAEKILLLLSDSKLNSKMGEESYKIARKNFSEDKITDDLLKVYDSLLNK